jgi:hypothetical protein
VFHLLKCMLRNEHEFLIHRSSACLVIEKECYNLVSEHQSSEAKRELQRESETDCEQRESDREGKREREGGKRGWRESETDYKRKGGDRGRGVERYKYINVR